LSVVTGVEITVEMIQIERPRSLYVSAAVFGLLCPLALALILPSGTSLNFVSGSWMALGVDLRLGVFYRPLLSEAGFGGTRYFPLWIILHAGLQKIGLSPLLAGHLISLASAVTWIIGAVRLMRGLALPRGLARALSLLSLCTGAGAIALSTVRGDLLPAALNLWGIVYALRALRPERDAAAVTIGAGFFTLAILAKVSAVYGVLAMAVCLAVNGLPRRAVALAGGTTIATLILLLAANAASDGRMLESMRASATGGARPWDYLHAPLTFLNILVRQDPMSIVITTMFFAGLTAIPRNAWSEPATMVPLASLAVLVALFSSPGIASNHLLDFLGFALIFVGYQITRGRIQVSLGAPALSIAAAMSIVLFFYDIREGRFPFENQQVAQVRVFLRQVNIGKRPVFSWNPLFPALEGDRPFLIDPFMFRLLRRDDPRFSSVLHARLTEQSFGAVVLQTDPANEAGLAMLADIFGPDFMPTLMANYELVGNFPPYFVYRPLRVR
jgi:hypothetical protein